MKNYFTLFLLILHFQLPYAQNIDINNIDIYRDSFGVPYIYTQTDAEAAYALAWVQCEDNFEDVQESLLAVNSLLAADRGKEGALLDAAAFIVDAYAVVEEKYETSFSEDFKKIIKAYTDGMNAFASNHPKEVRNKNLYPVSEYDVIAGYVLNMFFVSNVYFDLGRIFENKLVALDKNKVPGGSNGIAISPNKSSDGKTYLVCNSHQPLEGFAAWYEVQINTEEGWHFHGATFAAGITPFIGTNENLGWTHTVSYDDFSDVFKLRMVKGEKLKYHFDDKILELKKKKLKLKVKVGPFKIPITRTFYESVYGTVMKNKEGFYAVRFQSNMVIGQAEQWYRMNKANNFKEFKEAMQMLEVPCMNTIYSDKEGNIFYLANGLYPYRNPDYDWSNVIPGDRSETLWQEEFVPFDELLSITNPSCGYLFNANNTSFNATCEEEEVKESDFPKWMGHQTGKTGRSIRFQELFNQYESISYQDLKDIKYNPKMALPLHTRPLQNLHEIMQLDPNDHPEIKDVIIKFNAWDGDTGIDNEAASIGAVAIQYLIEYLSENHIADLNNDIPSEEYVKALAFAKKHLKKHFGTIDVKLGDLQKHVRGDKVLPVAGLPEVIPTMYTVPYKKGMYKSYLGDSYILFATYNKEGIEKIEAINCFGASNREDSPHYTDQMEMYVNRELKTIQFDALGKDMTLKGPYRPKNISF